MAKREQTGRDDEERPARGKARSEPIAERENGDENGARRSFLERFAAMVVGAIVAVVPPAAGLFTFMDPLRSRYKKQPKWIKVATLGQLPEDGFPSAFPVITDWWDAWNYHKPEEVATIFLKLDPGEQKPLALSSVCPHLGCSVNWSNTDDTYKCPCHSSVFGKDGAVKSGPPPRPMDTLEVEIRNRDEIWVKYEKFKTGHSTKEPE